MNQRINFIIQNNRAIETIEILDDNPEGIDFISSIDVKDRTKLIIQQIEPTIKALGLNDRKLAFDREWKIRMLVFPIFFSCLEGKSMRIDGERALIKTGNPVKPDLEIV